jgi:hypothetical protein
VAQRRDRIDARRAPRRNVASGERNAKEKERDGNERVGIVSFDAEQEDLEDAARRQCTSDAHADSHGRNRDAVTGDHRKNAIRRRADRQPDADVAAALIDDARKHAVNADTRKHERDARPERDQTRLPTERRGQV